MEIVPPQLSQLTVNQHQGATAPPPGGAVGVSQWGPPQLGFFLLPPGSDSVQLGRSVMQQQQQQQVCLESEISLRRKEPPLPEGPPSSQQWVMGAPSAPSGDRPGHQSHGHHQQHNPAHRPLHPHPHFHPHPHPSQYAAVAPPHSSHLDFAIDVHPPLHGLLAVKEETAEGANWGNSGSTSSNIGRVGGSSEKGLSKPEWKTLEQRLNEARETRHTEFESLMERQRQEALELCERQEGEVREMAMSGAKEMREIRDAYNREVMEMGGEPPPWAVEGAGDAPSVFDSAAAAPCSSSQPAASSEHQAQSSQAATADSKGGRAQSPHRPVKSRVASRGTNGFSSGTQSTAAPVSSSGQTSGQSGLSGKSRGSGNDTSGGQSGSGGQSSESQTGVKDGGSREGGKDTTSSSMSEMERDKPHPTARGGTGVGSAGGKVPSSHQNQAQHMQMHIAAAAAHAQHDAVAGKKPIMHTSAPPRRRLKGTPGSSRHNSLRVSHDLAEAEFRSHHSVDSSESSVHQQRTSRKTRVSATVSDNGVIALQMPGSADCHMRLEKLEVPGVGPIHIAVPISPGDSDSAAQLAQYLSVCSTSSTVRPPGAPYHEPKLIPLSSNTPHHPSPDDHLSSAPAGGPPLLHVVAPETAPVIHAGDRCSLQLHFPDSVPPSVSILGGGGGGTGEPPPDFVFQMTDGRPVSVSIGTPTTHLPMFDRVLPMPAVPADNIVVCKGAEDAAPDQLLTINELLARAMRLQSFQHKVAETARIFLAKRLSVGLGGAGSEMLESAVELGHAMGIPSAHDPDGGTADRSVPSSVPLPPTVGVGFGSGDHAAAPPSNGVSRGPRPAALLTKSSNPLALDQPGAVEVGCKEGGFPHAGGDSVLSIQAAGGGSSGGSGATGAAPSIAAPSPRLGGREGMPLPPPPGFENVDRRGQRTPRRLSEPGEREGTEGIDGHLHDPTGSRSHSIHSPASSSSSAAAPATSSGSGGRFLSLAQIPFSVLRRERKAPVTCTSRLIAAASPSTASNQQPTIGSPHLAGLLQRDLDIDHLDSPGCADENASRCSGYQPAEQGSVVTRCSTIVEETMSELARIENEEMERERALAIRAESRSGAESVSARRGRSRGPDRSVRSRSRGVHSGGEGNAGAPSSAINAGARGVSGAARVKARTTKKLPSRKRAAAGTPNQHPAATHADSNASSQWSPVTPASAVGGFMGGGSRGMVVGESGEGLAAAFSVLPPLGAHALAFNSPSERGNNKAMRPGTVKSGREKKRERERETLQQRHEGGSSIRSLSEEMERERERAENANANSSADDEEGEGNDPCGSSDAQPAASLESWTPSALTQSSGCNADRSEDATGSGSSLNDNGTKSPCKPTQPNPHETGGSAIKGDGLAEGGEKSVVGDVEDDLSEAVRGVAASLADICRGASRLPPIGRESQRERDGHPGSQLATDGSGAPPIRVVSSRWSAEKARERLEEAEEKRDRAGRGETTRGREGGSGKTRPSSFPTPRPGTPNEPIMGGVRKSTSRGDRGQMIVPLQQSQQQQQQQGGGREREREKRETNVCAAPESTGDPPGVLREGGGSGLSQQLRHPSAGSSSKKQRGGGNVASASGEREREREKRDSRGGAVSALLSLTSTGDPQILLTEREGAEGKDIFGGPAAVSASASSGRALVSSSSGAAPSRGTAQESPPHGDGGMGMQVPLTTPQPPQHPHGMGIETGDGAVSPPTDDPEHSGSDPVTGSSGSGGEVSSSDPNKSSSDGGIGGKGNESGGTAETGNGQGSTTGSDQRPGTAQDGRATGSDENEENGERGSDENGNASGENGDDACSSSFSNEVSVSSSSQQQTKKPSQQQQQSQSLATVGGGGGEEGRG
uniref:Uncharacterized protein n=1 Tax=Chromera velia CCMP2878 TaxID=1169474 RepID=A0A0G4GS24_9ALVE|eukprot:Cvel_23073.t1-p1 / transcript=Cvel_23073.t1 / gene=Cvel_23073 / organism=Chromera_velia_CCMP2878 / gene_product=hypothetical protein / transcript_product=hypothetical protein / location=Cvel_scaffold2336:23451-29479(-) / protein_length=1856 / sequence_SO=supercontig / SO=protein_coding / is_pseudo=false